MGVPGRDARERLSDIAGRQAGYVTAAQAVAAGYSHQAQWYHRRQGHWIPVARGVVRLATWPVSARERFVVACLLAGPDATVVRMSALEVHGVRGAHPPVIQVMAPRRRREPAGVWVFDGRVPAEDRCDAGGFAVTTPRRTLRDLRAARPSARVRWAGELVRLGLLAEDEAASCLRSGLGRA